jgi:hypothetical protein
MRLLREITKFIKKLIVTVRVAIDRYFSEAVRIGYILKDVVNSPIAEMLVKLTKSDLDDKTLSLLRKVLNVLFPDFKFQGKGKKAELEYVASVAEEIQKMSKDMKQAVLFKAVSLIAKELASKDKVSLDSHEADLYAQVYYSKSKLANG